MHSLLIRIMLHRVVQYFSKSLLIPQIRALSSGQIDRPAVAVSRGETSGTLTLQRPKLLNALNADILNILTAQLLEWERDPSVQCVVMRGRERGVFCAGGDVKLLLESDNLKGDKPFLQLSKENCLVHLISLLQTPCVSLIYGVTMGAGVGLAYYSKYRIATDNTVCCFPETAIGLSPDVGATFLLSRLPGALGMYLGLTGAKLTGGDVAACGIATHFIRTESVDLFEEELSRVEDSHELDNLVNRYSSEVKPSDNYTQNWDSINYVFSSYTLGDMLARLRELDSEWSRNTIDTLLKMSPTALMVTHRALSMSGKLSLQECLRMECNLGLNYFKHSDIFEGIRRVLVDKVTTRCNWNPATLEEVTPELVTTHFAESGGQCLSFYKPTDIRV